MTDSSPEETLEAAREKMVKRRHELAMKLGSAAAAKNTLVDDLVQTHLAIAAIEAAIEAHRKGSYDASQSFVG